MGAMLSQTIDLILQIGIVMMAVVGYITFRKKKYNWHAQIMTIGLAMILASFLLVMVPSLLMNYMTFNNPKSPVFDWASIIHIPFGIIGLGAGVFLVVRWARNDYKLAGMKATNLMRITMVSWIANVIIGAAIYFTMPS